MTKAPVTPRTCHVCGKVFAVHTMQPWVAVRPGVARMIEAARPGWTEGD